MILFHKAPIDWYITGTEDNSNPYDLYMMKSMLTIVNLIILCKVIF